MANLRRNNLEPRMTGSVIHDRGPVSHFRNAPPKNRT